MNLMFTNVNHVDFTFVNDLRITIVTRGEVDSFTIINKYLYISI